MNRLRNRLIFVFILATLLPVCLTVWTMLSLLELSRGLAPLAELDAVSGSLETTGRELYRISCESLKRDAEEGRVAPLKLAPSQAQGFWDSGSAEQFERAGEHENRLDYFVRHGDEVWEYSRPLPVAMEDLRAQIADSRQALERASAHDVRRGFGGTLIVIASGLWLAALGALIFLAHRITNPVQQLTRGLGRVAAGDLSARVERSGTDEIGAAVDAFNRMADQLEQSRERLIHVTRLASWQALARKMAHEVKNSLTLFGSRWRRSSAAPPLGWGERSPVSGSGGADRGG